MTLDKLAKFRGVCISFEHDRQTTVALLEPNFVGSLMP
jgi:hypothetical protein